MEETTGFFYSDKILVPTDNVDEKGKSTDVAGFYWRIMGRYYDDVSKTLKVNIQTLVNSEEKATRIRQEEFKNETDGSYERALSLVQSRPLFGGSRAIPKDNPMTGENETESFLKSIGSKIAGFFGFK